MESAAASDEIELDRAFLAILDRLRGQRFSRQEVLEAMIFMAQEDPKFRLHVLETAFDLQEPSHEVSLHQLLKP